MSIEDKYENLKIYVAGLEATLKQRGNRIKDLEAQLDKQMKSERAEAMKSYAYKQGWKDCSNKMQNLAMQAARELRNINEGAWKLYLEGEKLGEQG